MSSVDAPPKPHPDASRKRFSESGRIPSTLDAVRRTTDAWLTRRRAVVASVASIAMVSLIAATPASPFHPVLPDQSDGPVGMVARMLFLDHVPRGALIALGFLAMASAGVAFLLILRACELGLMPLRTVVVLTLTYAAIILLLPLLLSRDVFSYAYYGRIVSRYGGNPFSQTPANYPANDLSKYVWPGWRSTPSVYGAVFVWVSAAITSMFHSLTQTIFAFRALAVGAMLGSVWFVAKLVQQVRPSKTAYAVAFIGLNPVVLFHTLGGGHVDALVMLSVAAAAYLVATKRELPATAVLTLGALVKVSAAVPLVLLIVYVVARAVPERRRRVALTHVGVAAGIGLVVSAPFLTSSNPTLGMVQLVQHASWIAPPELMEHVFQAIGQLMGGNTGGTVGVVIARLTMYSCLAAGLFLIARQVARKAPHEDLLYLGAVWGWALLLMMLFSPTLFAWYFCWVLPVAWALPRVPRRTLEISFLALVTSQLTTENFQLPGWIHVQLPIGHPVLIVLLVWFLHDLWRRLRHDVPLDVDVEAYQA
jgi:Glycosyltransferase family 87